MTLCPTRTVRTIGAKMTMNTIGKSHNRPNSTIGSRRFCLREGLNRNSRIANGSTRRKLTRVCRSETCDSVQHRVFVLQKFLHLPVFFLDDASL